MNQYIPTLQDYAPSELFDLEELADRQGVLELSLVDAGGHKVRISFGAYLAYRKLDEGDAMVTLAQLSATSKPGCSFYLVEQSDFVDWFIAQGHGVRKASALRHYAIVTIDDVIDVISTEIPSIYQTSIALGQQDPIDWGGPFPGTGEK